MWLQQIPSQDYVADNYNDDDGEYDAVKDIKAGKRAVLCLLLTLGMCAVSPQGLPARDDDDDEDDGDDDGDDDHVDFV